MAVHSLAAVQSKFDETRYNEISIIHLLKSWKAIYTYVYTYFKCIVKSSLEFTLYIPWQINYSWCNWNSKRFNIISTVHISAASSEIRMRKCITHTSLCVHFMHGASCIAMHVVYTYWSSSSTIISYGKCHPLHLRGLATIAASHLPWHPHTMYWYAGSWVHEQRNPWNATAYLYTWGEMGQSRTQDWFCKKEDSVPALQKTPDFLDPRASVLGCLDSIWHEYVLEWSICMRFSRPSGVCGCNPVWIHCIGAPIAHARVMACFHLISYKLRESGWNNEASTLWCHWKQSCLILRSAICSEALSAPVWSCMPQYQCCTLASDAHKVFDIHANPWRPTYQNKGTG